MSVQTTGRLSQFAGDTLLEVEICTCGVLFAAPVHMLEARRFDGETFYCPNGHSLSYKGDKVRLKHELKQARDRIARETALRDQAEASARAQRGAATRARNERDRIKTRVANGVCPCCGRTFQDLARHMASKHPDYAEETKE